MATKYCDVSLATGLNDGTSTANAWQSLVDVLDGTPTSGSYAAGDVIIIRTADGGGNLTESRASSLTTTTKTGAQENPVLWQFDDGTTWAQSGTFELTFTGGTTWTINPGNQLLAGKFGNRRLQVRHNTATDFDLTYDEATRLEGVSYIRGTTPGAANETRIFSSLATSGGSAYFVNCYFSCTTPEGGGTNPSAAGTIETTAGATGFFYFSGCVFDLNSAISSDSLFVGAQTYGLFRFNGCTINFSSNHTILPQPVGTTTYRSTDYYFKDCDFGSLDEAQSIHSNGTNGNVGTINITAESAAGADFFRRTPVELVQYDSTGNYPTLSATIPDVNTTWSMRVWPDDDNCGPESPARIGSMTKWFNGTAATKDIRLELLIKDTAAYSSPQNDEWWIEISYVNDSGSTIEFEGSYANGAMTTSTASWSATTYGGNSYDKYKIVVTTANSIKQYSFVTVTLYSIKPAVNAASSASGDFYFVDPDFQIE